MIQMHQHGIIIIVQRVVLQVQIGGGCCLLAIGIEATLTCSTCAVRPILATCTTATSASFTGCVRPFLSNLASNMVQEMAQQVTHTQ